MSQIRVDHLTFSYDGSVEPVFENATFSLDTDWKLGLIGRNGKGKSTFLRLLTREFSGQGTLTISVPVDYFPYAVTSKPYDNLFIQLPHSFRWTRCIYVLDYTC